MKNSLLNRLNLAVSAATFFAVQTVGAQLFEGFDVITTLPGSGWVQDNNSSPVGSTNWFQGNPAAFVSFSGSTDSYIGANFNNCGGTGTISNWLITPNFTIKNGDTVRFYTRTTVPGVPEYPDRLQVRMSTAGASSNCGTLPSDVGDFTTLLLDINPTLTTGVYPQSWTQFQIIVTGLAAPTSGRFAFRYFVTGGGPTGTNADYIGIDNFNYIPYVCPVITVTPASLINGTAGVAYGSSLSNTGTLGATVYAVTAGSLPPGMSLSTGGTFVGAPTATGTFTFTVTVTDASGCTGSTVYSLTIDCPTGVASLAPFPDLCDYDVPYVLTEGSPSGGTYSGTGVTGSSFDPSAGTSLITYSFTDVYGCLQSTASTITVNAAPIVSQTPLADVCEGIAAFTLTGGSPAGGAYSGTGVSAGAFDPTTAGTFTITYTYTDATTGCFAAASEDILVNPEPVVTLASFSDVCEDIPAFALTGGSPVGGTYSGTGVTAGNFDPSTLGTFTITYDYTDGNGCSGQATADIDVITCLGLSESDGLANFSCFPSPTNGLVTVQFELSKNADIVLNVFGIDGKVVMTKSISASSGKFSESLDLSSLSAGTYVVEVETEQGSARQKVVKE